MKEFEGNLEEISPQRIIQKENDKDFDSFFLVLGLIYNDLKDLIFFWDSFIKTYRQPGCDGPEPASVHLGQYGGIQNHLNRLTISFISEFLIFLDKTRPIRNSPSFLLFEKKLPDYIKQDWFNILRALDDKGNDGFLQKIARIRNNVSFHYDQSLTQLRTGFVKKFYDSPKDDYNKKAFYLLGGSMETTRFFYCDGAVEEYLKEHMKTSSDNYYKDIRILVEKTNSTIMFMMDVYLKEKRNRS
jgi:hypothetical protein